ncbi:flagellar export chaperone FliS [Desulfuribacillus stibiiarsenatis]|uniref:Flagellar export chaperone FliS n=1 Tax=Desulfuribacillus stibiiarsenatis TaxID=1390249 RepID=A0A1E5L9H5_9FIRM|nr:flagellar export chaperone FliS [Desulfuribacillus stibiiarsenatis]
MDVANRKLEVSLLTSIVVTKEEVYKKKPEELTMLLYEALEKNLIEAAQGIESNQMGLANSKLQKANDIIQRLGAGINYEAGIIADQLHVLYEYLAEKVIVANQHKNQNLCKEVLVIVKRLSDSWKEAMDLAKKGTAGVKRKTGSYDDQIDFASSYTAATAEKALDYKK